MIPGLVYKLSDRHRNAYKLIRSEEVPKGYKVNSIGQCVRASGLYSGLTINDIKHCKTVRKVGTKVQAIDGGPETGVVIDLDRTTRNVMIQTDNLKAWYTPLKWKVVE